MRISLKQLLGVICLYVAVYSGCSGAANLNVANPANTAPKEWTFMVFLNGNNSLDSYGALNISQLEQVGSTNDINFVVQWASQANEKTKRILVQKNPNPKPNEVISPVVQEMGRVDMGDYQNLIEFVRWSVANYPAKHYFLVFWNHGSGWHRNLQVLKPFDISFDDISGHSITTAQEGLAMAEIAKIIGHKLDILGNDACLMASVEVAAEVADSVQVYIGSEELEPGLGWPYDKLAQRWAAQPTMPAASVARILTEEYVKLFQAPGSTNQVTLSALDLENGPQLSHSVAALGNQLGKLNPADMKLAIQAAGQAQTFNGDYVDLGDFINTVEHARIGSVPADVLAGVRQALGSYVIDSKTTVKLSKSTGATIWLPQTKSGYQENLPAYQALKFQAQTSWASALAAMAGTMLTD